MPPRKYVTLHAPMPRRISEHLYKYLEEQARHYRLRIWVDPHPEDAEKIIIWVDQPEVWHERAPTEKELDFMDELIAAGRMEQYQDVLQRGLPPAMR